MPSTVTEMDEDYHSPNFGYLPEAIEQVGTVSGDLKLVETWSLEALE